MAASGKNCFLVQKVEIDDTFVYRTAETVIIMLASKITKHHPSQVLDTDGLLFAHHLMDKIAIQLLLNKKNFQPETLARTILLDTANPPLHVPHHRWNYPPGRALCVTSLVYDWDDGKYEKEPCVRRPGQPPPTFWGGSSPQSDTFVAWFKCKLATTNGDIIDKPIFLITLILSRPTSLTAFSLVE